MSDTPARVETPIERHESLREPHRRLESLYREHLPAAGRILEASTPTALELFYLAIVQRSLHVVQGFMDLFKRWNLIAAAPLVRLQIDNLTRTSYVAHHSDPLAFSMELWVGEFHQMRDPKGRRLTDSRLVDLAKQHHPWLFRAYKAANAWVHLSQRHIWLPFDIPEHEIGGPVESRLSVAYVRNDYSEPLLHDILTTMVVATSDVMGYVLAWNPRENQS